MLITVNDPFSKYVEIIDKITGQSITDAGLLIVEWNTETKTGKERRWMNNSGDDNSKNLLGLDVQTTIPNAKTVIKIPFEDVKSPYTYSLLAKLLCNEKDVELKIVS